YSEASAAGPLTPDTFNGHRAVTAAVAPGVLVHDSWAVDQATGGISRLGELVQPMVSGPWDRVDITPFRANTVGNELVAPSYSAVGFRYSTGYAIHFYRLDPAGVPVNEGAVSISTPVEDVGVAPLGRGGVMAATRAGDDTVELQAWEA